MDVGRRRFLGFGGDRCLDKVFKVFFFVGKWIREVVCVRVDGFLVSGSFFTCRYSSEIEEFEFFS